MKESKIDNFFILLDMLVFFIIFPGLVYLCYNMVSGIAYQLIARGILFIGLLYLLFKRYLYSKWKEN